MITFCNRLYKKNRLSTAPVIWVILIGMLALSMGACSSSPSTTNQQPSWLYRSARSIIGGGIDVKVEIADNANQNSPLAVDLVVVYEEKLMEQLMGMTADDWFAKRNQIRRDYLDGAGFDSWGWEWIPGQKVPVQRLPLKPAAIGGVIFVKFNTPGAHRSRINPFDDVTILLREDDFAVNIPNDISDNVEFSE
jgi:type VI secretion system protein